VTRTPDHDGRPAPAAPDRAEQPADPPGPEFELLLDQVLDRDAAGGDEGTREELREVALAHRGAIEAAASAEPAPPAADPTLRGLALVLPVLAAVSAAVFVPGGLALREWAGHPNLGEGLITAGMICGCSATGAALAAAAWHLSTLRGGGAAKDRAALEAALVAFLHGRTGGGAEARQLPPPDQTLTP
jgi:hypothetical protein